LISLEQNAMPMTATQGDAVAQDSRTLANFLRQMPCLAELQRETLEQLAQSSRLLLVAEADELCQEGDKAESLLVLLEGQIALSGAAANGNRAVVEVIRPVAPLQLATVLARLTYPSTATAVSACRVLAIQAEGLHALMAEVPELATALVRAQAMEFDAMVRQVCDLKVRTAAERLASYLLSLAQEHGDAPQFRLPVRKRLLAAQLGCGQENLSRAFATLRGFGVETHGIRIILHDIPRLRLFAFSDGAAAAELT
jgi:CRP/FNR family transcriptional activator FtrB